MRKLALVVGSRSILHLWEEIKLIALYAKMIGFGILNSSIINLKELCIFGCWILIDIFIQKIKRQNKAKKYLLVAERSAQFLCRRVHRFIFVR